MPTIHNCTRLGVRIALALVVLAPLAASLAGTGVATQVAALPEAKRRILFARMLQQDGERCPTVTRTFFQGTDDHGAAYWSASCEGGKDWTLMIEDTARGETRMVECDILKAVNGPRCFTRFKR